MTFSCEGFALSGRPGVGWVRVVLRCRDIYDSMMMRAQIILYGAQTVSRVSVNMAVRIIMDISKCVGNGRF